MTAIILPHTLTPAPINASGITVTIEAATGGAYRLSDCMIVGHSLHGLLDSGAGHVVNMDDETITIIQHRA